MNDAPGVTDLYIELCDVCIDGTLGDSNSACLAIAGMLFKPTTVVPLRLKKICITKMNFEDACAILTQSLDFQNVRDLRLSECLNTDFLLEQLEHLHLSLETLILWE